MSSPPTNEENKDPSPSKLDQNSLGEHTKRTQGNHPPNISKKLYVNSWVASQTAEEELSPTTDDNATPLPVPIIVLTDADQAEPESDVPAVDQDQQSKRKASSMQKRKDPTRRGSLDYPSSSGYKRTSPGPRRKTMTVVDQPILEEPEDGGNMEESNADKLKMIRSEAAKMLAPTAAIHEPSDAARQGLSVASRQRAKSYPAYSQDVGQPMLLLPHQAGVESSKQEPQKTSEPEAESKIRKFAQMAVMAKKWKKRSDSTGDATTEGCEESVAARQKKRPYIDVPRALKLDILEDAYPIVQKTYQMYKSYLGPKHQLSVLAEQHLDKLSVQLRKKGT